METSYFRCYTDVANEDEPEFIHSIIDELDGEDRAIVASSRRPFKSGQTVTYTIRNGQPNEIAIVEKILQTQFFPFANLKFTRVDIKQKPAIDIQLNYPFPKTKGQAGVTLKQGTSKPVIRLSRPIVYGSPEFQGTVLHEMMHAVANAAHEFLNPRNNQIKWFADKVKAYYKKRGWSDKEIKNQILTRIKDHSKTLGTPFDPQSIMNYTFDKSLYTGVSFHQGTVLSKGDKLLLQQLYGGAPTSITTRPPTSTTRPPRTPRPRPPPPPPPPPPPENIVQPTTCTVTCPPCHFPGPNYDQLLKEAKKIYKKRKDGETYLDLWKPYMTLMKFNAANNQLNQWNAIRQQPMANLGLGAPFPGVMNPGMSFPGVMNPGMSFPGAMNPGMSFPQYPQYNPSLALSGLNPATNPLSNMSMMYPGMRPF